MNRFKYIEIAQVNKQIKNMIFWQRSYNCVAKYKKLRLVPTLLTICITQILNKKLKPQSIPRKKYFMLKISETGLQ